MRLTENPVNPLTQATCEWLAAPPPAELRPIEEQARSIVTRNDSPDVPHRYSVNPYRGCQHACAYCYARRTHEYFEAGAGTDFDTRVFVKINAPELLAAELAAPRWRRAPLAFSGVTDCYQPLEARYRLTRRCLEVCCDRANPVSIVTKAYLVTRDLDVLTELHRRAHADVVFSITFADDELARLLEPYAPPPSRRFEAIRRIAAAGLPAGVMVAPIIPGLNDRDIPALLARAAECGARWAGYQPIRLPGSVAEVFLTRLRRALPDAAARVEARIRDLRGGRLNTPEFGRRMQGQGAYWASVERLFGTMATRHGLGGGSDCPAPPGEPCAPRPKQLLLFGPVPPSG